MKALSTSRKSTSVILFFPTTLTLFQQDRLDVVQCCVWVWTQNAHCSLARACLLRVGFWWVGSFQTARQSCLVDLWVVKKRKCGNLLWFWDGNQVSVFPCRWNAPHSENRNNYLTMWDKTLVWRCCKALLGTLFGPGTLQTLRPWMESWASGVWLLSVKLWKANCKHASPR